MPIHVVCDVYIYLLLLHITISHDQKIVSMRTCDCSESVHWYLFISTCIWFINANCGCCSEVAWGWRTSVFTKIWNIIRDQSNLFLDKNTPGRKYLANLPKSGVVIFKIWWLCDCVVLLELDSNFAFVTSGVPSDCVLQMIFEFDRKRNMICCYLIKSTLIRSIIYSFKWN